MVNFASGEERTVSGVNLSNVLYAEDTMALVEDALSKVSAARGQLGALEHGSEAISNRHFANEKSVATSLERGEVFSSQQALVDRIQSEFRLKSAIQYQRAEHTNHWQRFLELVNAHT